MAMIENSKDLRRYAAHAAWAVLASVVTLLMILGHPILLAFLPLVILVWVVGHIAIWVVKRLSAKGRRINSEPGSEGRSWPIGLMLAVIGTGVLTFAGVFQVLVTGYMGKLYPYHYVNLWTIMLVIKLSHAICFVGLLLRHQWSRFVTALLAAGWALLMASQIIEHLPPSASSNVAELMIAFGIMVSLSILGIHLVVSRKAKSFLKN